MTEIPLPAPAIKNTSTRISEEVLLDRFRWIVEFTELNGWGPSYRDMGRGWGITHAAVKQSLKHMIEERWLAQGEGARQIKIDQVKAAEIRASRGDGNTGAVSKNAESLQD